MRHLDDVKMTYWQHFRGACWYIFWLSIAVAVLLVHAIMPFVFERTASSIIEKIYRKMKK